MNRLVQYPWPGNIRELQNILEREAVLAHGPILELKWNLVPPAASAPPLAASTAAHTSPPGMVGGIAPPGPAASPIETVPPSTLEEVERRHIVEVLEQTEWIIEGPGGAARVLDLHPNTLRSRMKKLGIRRASH
jgi:formate hydrogenlyase transcriptional activator